MIKKYEKLIFIVLCIIMFTVNGFMSLGKYVGANLSQVIGGGIGSSILSIPLWSCIGVIISNIGLFFYKLKNVNDGVELSLFQKGSLGLLFGIVLKPLLEIIW